MKKNLLIYVAGLFMVAFAACEKDYEGRLVTQPTELSPENKATLQFYNSTINSVRTYVFIDNVLTSGTATSYTATAALYPSTAPSKLTVEPGARSIVIRDTLATTTQPAVTVTGTFDAGASYTVFSYDTLNRAKALLVKDNIVVPADTTARLRFANFPFSTVAIPNIDVFSVRRQANIFTNVPVNSVTDFIPMAAATTVSDTLHVRATGTTANLVSVNGFNPLRKRNYTLVFRGSYRTSGTGAVARAATTFLSY